MGNDKAFSAERKPHLKFTCPSPEACPQAVPSWRGASNPISPGPPLPSWLLDLCRRPMLHVAACPAVGPLREGGPLIGREEVRAQIWARDLGFRGRNPAVSGFSGFQLPRSRLPAPGSRRGGPGEELGASPPRGGTEGGAGAGWVGDARRSGAPHRPRRLARAPTVPAAAGGGSQAVGGGGEKEEAETGAPLAADLLPRLSRERYGAPALRPRAPALSLPRAQAGAAAAARG